MHSRYVSIPRYRFIAPNPLNETDFIIAKRLQNEGSRRIKYLTLFNKSKLKGFAILFGGLYVLIAIFWTLVWLVSLQLPNSGAADMYNHDTFPNLAGYLSIGLIYVVYEVLWEYFTAKGYNSKLHNMIKKSVSYSDFRKIYYDRYKK